MLNIFLLSTKGQILSDFNNFLTSESQSYLVSIKKGLTFLAALMNFRVKSKLGNQISTMFQNLISKNIGMLYII